MDDIRTLVENAARALKDNMDDKIKTTNTPDIMRSAKPCPFCGSYDLHFTYTPYQGHGESGFNNARVICDNCSGSKGMGFGYGNPNESDKNRAYAKWNERYLSEKKYSLDEMRECFEQSRLTHPMVGFKHDTFEDFIKSTEK